MRLFCYLIILLLLYRLNKCLFIDDVDLDIVEEEDDNNEDLGSGDIDGDFYDSTFCDISIQGNDVSYVNNQTIVQAGNAHKYNISCVVNDKQINLGDKHYTIDLILYGPNRQLKAWGNNIPTGKNSSAASSGLVSTEKQFILSKLHSFGWTGPSRLMCSVKKYNHILNRFKRCEKYIYLNIQEKMGMVNKQIPQALFPSHVIQPPMFRSMIALTTANLVKEVQVNRTSTTILTTLTTIGNLTTEGSTTTEFPLTKGVSEGDKVKIVLFAQHDNNKINRNKLNTNDPTASKLDGHFENIDFGLENAKTKISRSILILSLFLVTFLSIIGLLVYFNYYHNKTNVNKQPTTSTAIALATTIDDEAKPIKFTITSCYEKIEETTVVTKTQYEPTTQDNTTPPTTNQLRYIDENYKNEDSIKFLPDI